MRCGPVDKRTIHAKLTPSTPTVRTSPTSKVVVLHNAHTDASLFLRHAGPHRNYRPAWLVAGDYGTIGRTQPDCGCTCTSSCAVVLEVCPAHSGCFYLEDNLSRSGSGVFETLQFET